MIGVPVGIASAARRNSLLDGVTMVGSLIGVSMPIFWLGLMEIMLFAVFLKWLPTGGRLSTGIEIKSITNLYLVDSLLTGNIPGFIDAFQHIIMPAIALATIPMAIIARMTRSSMLDVLQEDYIRTATAKGLEREGCTFPTCTQERLPAGDHHHRNSGWNADGWCSADRNDFCLAGDR